MFRSVLILSALLPVAATTPIQPGKWQTTITILDVAMPNAPPGMAAMMRGRPTTVSACVTPAQAAAGPRAALNEANGRCRYGGYSANGGRVDSTVICEKPGGTMTMHSTGTYTPTAIMLDGTSTATGRAPMTMKTRIVSRRIGAC